MAPPLLELPRELLVQILAFLPVRALLKFAQASRYAQTLANSNLHTLNLGICPIRKSRFSSTPDMERYKTAQYRICAPAAEPPSSALPLGENNECFSAITVVTTELQNNGSSDRGEESDKIWVRIPDAHTYDYSTLLDFHTALTRSILIRHNHVLQTLDLSLWTLTIPIAKAIAGLSALKILSIRIEDDLYARAVPRSYIAMERLEQREAWSVLAQHAIWKDRIHTLRVTNADVTTEQLGALLQGSRRCRELWLSGCGFVGRELWGFLSKGWQGVAALQILVVANCGGVLDETTLEAMGRLNGLQFLDLQACYGLDGDTVKRWNRDVWHIPHVFPPDDFSNENSLILEVDPAYR